MGRHNFPRAARLLQALDFAVLRHNSKRVSSLYFQVTYRSTGLPLARLGMAVSRRVSKRAVIRNRIKRQVRESFRCCRESLLPVDVLIIARTNAAMGTPFELRTDLTQLWQKLRIEP